ncbi:baseplate assembly protein [Stutzerimonas xanthomarina]|uniref:baseplate assembly protein n=1 Tax=Stutzerimonas xanthomarina TaxID=271420 RepID=UPI003AA9CAF1
MTIDLSLLPAPTIIEPLDYEQILTERKARLLSLYPEAEQAAMAELLELESEPLTKLLQENAYRELILRQRINDGAHAVMLAFSGGADLEHLLALLGAERLDGEPDDEYRQRGQLAPFGFSTAGPVNAYRYHALSAASDVLDAKADQPQPGVVRVTVLSRTRQAATPELLQQVASALSADDIRPLNDTVQVQAAILRPWAINARIYVGSGAAPEPLLAAAQKAAEAYAAAQHAINAPVRLSGIFAALHQPGALRVELLSPAADIEPQVQTAPLCSAVTLTLVTGHE